MERLVTVHGISSEGPWQEMLKFLLYPFFDCTSIKYTHYRWLGPLKLVLEPWVLATGVIAVLGLRHYYIVRGVLPWMGVWLAVLLPAHLFTYYRRKLAFKAYMRQLNETSLAGERPHLIAHSFGTYLTGRA